MSKKTAVPRLRFLEFKDSGAINLENGNVVFEPISDKKHNSDLPVLAISQEHGAIPREQIDYNVSVSEKSLESYKVVQVGDFIISLRSFEGGIEYSTWHGICSPAYIILRKRRKIVEQYYKYYFKTSKYIQDLNKDLEGIRDGKMISYSQFSSIPIPLPDTREQQKIADCLTSLDELIAAENNKLDILKTHKNGLMQKLFPAGGEAIPQVRFEGFTNAWSQRKLGDVTEIRTGPFGSMLHAEDYVTDGTPIITTEHFKTGRLPYRKKGIPQVSEEDMKKLQRYILNTNDIVFSRVGSVDISALVSIEQEGWLFSGRVLRVRTGKNINSQYLHYELSTLRIKSDIVCRAVGQTMSSINTDILKKTVVCLPGCLDEQAVIGNLFHNLDELITAQTEKIETLKLHKKGLMQGLFPSAQEVFT